MEKREKTHPNTQGSEGLGRNGERFWKGNVGKKTTLKGLQGGGGLPEKSRGTRENKEEGAEVGKKSPLTDMR